MVIFLSHLVLHKVLNKVECCPRFYSQWPWWKYMTMWIKFLMVCVLRAWNWAARHIQMTLCYYQIRSLVSPAWCIVCMNMVDNGAFPFVLPKRNALYLAKTGASKSAAKIKRKWKLTHWLPWWYGVVDRMYYTSWQRTMSRRNHVYDIRQNWLPFPN